MRLAALLRVASAGTMPSLERSHPSIDLVLSARVRDLGEITVRRVLPTAQRKLVGPFIFLDHMGPTVAGQGQHVNVRPHPHINLATVTYLFAGEILHRDSLGFTQPIRPGDVNWMTAGRGVVHSERSDPASIASSLHGLQCWVALPTQYEEIEPSFRHHPKASLPELKVLGGTLHVILGEAYGQRSPVETLSPTLYVAAELERGAELQLPRDYAERAAYVVEGAISVGEQRFSAGDLVIFKAGDQAAFRMDQNGRVMLLGGAKLDGERHIYWNFVSSSLERIERAKQDWREGRFPKVPGDDVEFIPLPQD